MGLAEGAEMELLLDELTLAEALLVVLLLEFVVLPAVAEELEVIGVDDWLLVLFWVDVEALAVEFAVFRVVGFLVSLLVLPIAVVVIFWGLLALFAGDGALLLLTGSGLFTGAVTFPGLFGIVAFAAFLSTGLVTFVLLLRLMLFLSVVWLTVLLLLLVKLLALEPLSNEVVVLFPT